MAINFDLKGQRIGLLLKKKEFMHIHRLHNINKDDGGNVSEEGWALIDSAN